MLGAVRTGSAVAASTAQQELRNVQTSAHVAIGGAAQLLWHARSKPQTGRPSTNLDFAKIEEAAVAREPLLYRAEVQAFVDHGPREIRTGGRHAHQVLTPGVGTVQGFAAAQP